MDTTLLVILGFGLLMSAIALVGGAFVLVPDTVLDRLIQPLVSFAAGSLVGGALFFMLPQALGESIVTEEIRIFVWVVGGFTAFFALDQLLEWHHCHRPPGEHIRPLGPLLLMADGVHNLIGGLAIGAIMMADIQAGIAAWVAAAMHEIPQEMGDFGAIVHAGYTRRRALFYNFVSALTFPLGSVMAWALGQKLDVGFLVAFGAGSFLYIAAADLIPEVKRSETLRETGARFLAFVAGAGLLLAARTLIAGTG